VNIYNRVQIVPCSGLIIGIVNGGDNVAVKNKYCLSVRAIKTQEKIY